MCFLQRAFHLVMEAENRMGQALSTSGVAGNMASHGLHATPAHWMSNGGTKQYQYEVIAPNSRCGTNCRFLNAHNSFDPRHGRGGNWIVLRFIGSMCHVLLD